jgi:hypothetical protein
MNGIAKILSGIIAKALDFLFAGYGLVCDASFMKIIFHHINFQYTRCRNFIVKSWSQFPGKEIYSRLADKIADLRNREDDEKWYFRGR